MSHHFEDEDHSNDLNLKWNELFKQLEQYKEEFGDTNVPLNYAQNPKLANWVHYLRWSYKRYQAGLQKHGGLNGEKIASLDSLGFKWIVPT